MLVTRNLEVEKVEIDTNTIWNALIFVSSCILMTRSIRDYNKHDTKLWHLVRDMEFLAGLYIFTGYRWLV